MTDPNDSLLEAARVLARGGDLDAKLAALTEHAVTATGADMVTLHLLDEVGRWLLPVTSAPAAAPAVAIPASDAARAVADVPDTDPLAAPPPEGGIDLGTAPAELLTALGDRRSQMLDPRTDLHTSLSFVPSGTTSLAIVPLVTETLEGGAEVDGVLFAALGDRASGDVPPALKAIADLAAVAIRLTRLESALGERADWLDRMANTDPLTGLANRRTFDRMLQLELARAARLDALVGLALVTVDGLAEVRERSGDAEADNVLRRVAATLGQELRIVDTVARVGADTFAAICPGSAGPEAALRVRDSVARMGPSTADAETPTPGPTSVSVGVARFPEDGADAASLMAAAEGALEDARAQGPGSVVAPAPT